MGIYRKNIDNYFIAAAPGPGPGTEKGEGMKKKYNITGMGCAACSARIEKNVGKLPGVESVAVNLLANNMVVTFDESQLSGERIIREVEDSGYGAEDADTEDSHSQEAGGSDQAGGRQTENHSARDRARELRQLEAASMKRRFVVSLIFLIPLFYISMGHMMGMPLPSFLHEAHNPAAFYGVQFLLTVPIIIVNRKYYTVGFPMLIKGSPNMDSLIAIGSGAAVVLMYYESAGMILTLVTLGKYLETRSKGKTGDAIERLMDLAPKKATVIRDGEEFLIPVESIRVGEVVAVRPGESVAVDGIILTGETSLDQSALTGESVPVDKAAGDAVIAASINKSGYFTFEATKVGNDTTLAQIIALVEEAGSSKAPISKLADKVAGIFVPVVILIAAAAAVIWLLLGMSIDFALSIAIAVLVISCPCALGLATPVAIMVGTGRGAEKGILIKSAEVLETAGKVKAVVLDKTGTITEGKPEVTDFVLVRRGTDAEADETALIEEFLALAASLEKPSEHPLGQAIVREAQARGVEMREAEAFSAVSGRGVEARLDGRLYYAGNAAFMKEKGVALEGGLAGRSAQEALSALAEQGKTPLCFAEGQRLIGIIAVADRPKETSREAIRQLEEMGLEVIMLTGDNARTAESIRRELGITAAVAEVMPQDKEREIRRLQENGKKTAMVGDGINDAPAITRADVGIAIGAATDVAIESADVVLMKSDLLDVVKTVKLSRKTIRNIKQNLFWAFFYNVLGIPVAAGVLYPVFGFTLNPMLAAAAMSLSSVCVVTNALRLRYISID